MYQIVKVSGIVRITPDKFNKPLDEAAKEILQEEYEGLVDPDLGVVIAVLDVKVSDEGVIIPGDGATYHEAEYELLTYTPRLHEVVEGEVIEVTDFGLFIRLGPLDGFIHLSQIYDDYFSYDKRHSVLIGRDTKLEIKPRDVVRARVVTASIGGGVKGVRVGLTMRQPFLGKLEWIKKELDRIYKKPAKKEKEAKKGG
ncbi:MAG: DNA-directed RNA polymerase [Thermoprotei archaeon]|nr:MAG: DNA-directed RNA polymerase [Thermoprotei archaeon]RLF25056.1 MAG: DNA-directed RNA polymerase [Thermoprotei archaeon]